MRLASVLLGFLLLLSITPAVRAADEDLNEVVASAVKQAQSKFPNEKLKDEDVAVTLIDLREPNRSRTRPTRTREGSGSTSCRRMLRDAAFRRDPDMLTRADCPRVPLP